MEIKNIVFDFGGVLIDWDQRYLYNKLFDNKEEMEFFLAEVCSPAWNTALDAGLPFKEATQELAQKYPEFDKEIKAYYTRWLEMVKGDLPENVALLPLLAKKFKMYGLSNWASETFSWVFEKYEFFNVFEGIVLSGNEKVVKPDPTIFDILLQRYKLAANECLFIDDNAANVAAAKHLGFQTIHYSDGVNLKEELAKMNLLD